MNVHFASMTLPGAPCASRSFTCISRRGEVNETNGHLELWSGIERTPGTLKLARLFAAPVSAAKCWPYVRWPPAFHRAVGRAVLQPRSDANIADKSERLATTTSTDARCPMEEVATRTLRGPRPVERCRLRGESDGVAG
jgi:hypothetical protein